MIRRPPRSTRTDTLFPYTTLFRSENETVRDLFGGEAVFTGRIGMTPEGAITLTQLSGRAPDFRLSGSGRYEPGGTVRLDVSARSTQYGPLALAVRGTAERPQAVLRAESPGLGVGLRNLVARVDRTSTRLNSSH